jgi:hypothetical protein
VGDKQALECVHRGGVAGGQAASSHPPPCPKPQAPSPIPPFLLSPAPCPACTAEVKVWQAHHDNLKKCLMWAPVLSIEQQIEVRLLCLLCLLCLPHSCPAAMLCLAPG